MDHSLLGIRVAVTLEPSGLAREPGILPSGQRRHLHDGLSGYPRSEP